MNAYLKAVFLSLGAYTCWALGDASLKFMGRTAVPWHETVLFNGLGSAATIYIIVRLNGETGTLKPRSVPALAGLGALLLTAVFALIAGLRHLPLADFFVISFTTPLFVAGLGAFFLKERLSLRQLTAIAVGFLGVVITADPFHVIRTETNEIGYVLTISAALLFASVILIVRVLGKTESNQSLAFYPALILAAAGAVIGVMTQIVAPRPIELLVMVFSGVVGGIGWRWMAMATRTAPASLVAPAQYLQVITGAIIGFLIWGDRPTCSTIAGALVIAAAGLYLVGSTQKQT